jgi:Spy/CpxP family protein refolding chaperone
MTTQTTKSRQMTLSTQKITLWLGAVLFSLGIGCGNLDSAIGSDSLAVAGSDVSGEQLALPDGDGPGARDGAGRVGPSELSRLQSLLGLSAEQVAQIQPILDATRAALEDLRAQVRTGSLSPADAKAKVKAVHDAQKAQIMALLTPEQQAKFSAMREHHYGPFDVNRLAEVLGLSADQVSQISDLMAASQTKISDLHAQVEAGTLSADQAHAQIDSIRKDTQSAISSVLTQEQREQLAQIMSRPPRRDRSGPPPAP